MASLSTAADIVNASLVRIGSKMSIGHLYDGSAAAQLALNTYGQTRDEMLRSQDWDFAQRTVALTLLKSAPTSGYIPGFSPWNPATNPAVPWLFEYGYVDDCLKVRAIKPTPIFAGPNFDPQPHTFSISNDNAFTPPQRVILTNVADALMVYTARVTDPSLWAVDFAEAFTNQLGERLAPALASLQVAQMEAAEGAVSTKMASMEQG